MIRSRKGSARRRQTRSMVIGRAVETAVRNPVRSILTILGLAIGVGAFLTMVSWGTGARASIMEQFEIQGTRVVYIWTNVNRRDFGGGAKPLSDADVEALLRDSTLIERVAPRVTEKYHVKSELTTYRTSVTGSTPDFVRIREWPILTGGMFGDTDVQSRAKVAVVGSTVARKLFWGHDPVGRVITIGSSLPCRVIGVLESKGEQVTGEDMDDIVLIPATTYRAFWERRSAITSSCCRCATSISWRRRCSKRYPSCAAPTDSPRTSRTISEWRAPLGSLESRRTSRGF